MTLSLKSKEIRTDNYDLKGMNIMKKRTMIALLSVLAVSASMATASIPAGAVSMSDNGVRPIVTGDTDPNSITFHKDIVIHNESTSVGTVAVDKVYGPAITYTYSIAAASAAELSTITDSNNNTVSFGELVK